MVRGRAVSAFHHNRSVAPASTFVKVNCAAIQEHYSRASYLGMKKGAFTGAYSSKAGRVELAHEHAIPGWDRRNRHVPPGKITGSCCRTDNSAELVARRQACPTPRDLRNKSSSGGGHHARAFPSGPFLSNQCGKHTTSLVKGPHRRYWHPGRVLPGCSSPRARRHVQNVVPALHEHPGSTPTRVPISPMRAFNEGKLYVYHIDSIKKVPDGNALA